MVVAILDLDQVVATAAAVAIPPASSGLMIANQVIALITSLLVLIDFFILPLILLINQIFECIIYFIY